ncbi:rab proteins geranylgeranyltransferase component A 1 isoform X2 [Labrus mixtus]|uniref:rab proteins geranylgeranyltransferase component A 1 isoform X2 n=1 Tax=Labrus mixtus TaxID=508554 RepID=UPI0029C0A7C1|nr:rab proteins geranylgeranyltransferase component A 1 isoform X2 [Labrus mixtus]
MAAEDLPSEFDVVILGTGLAESVVAAAFSRVGQRVLHVDRRSYYAANWASFTFNGLLTWIQKQHEEESQPEEPQDWSSLVEEGEELIHLSNSDSSSISNVQVFCYTSEEEEEEVEEKCLNTTEEERGGVDEVAVKETSETECAEPKEETTEEADGTADREEEASHTEGEEPEADQPAPSAAQSQSVPTKKKIGYAQLVKEGRRFNIDLVSKLMYSRGSLVDLLIKSNVSRYAEFKNVTRILTYRNGSVEQVPCSRADVFANRQLSVVEKRKLMRFLTSCVEETEEQQAYRGRPYLEFLRDQQLGDNLQHFLLHSIAMVTEDTPTEEGLASTRHFLRCLGRYGNTPFLFPVYGLGEIPQCFCRMCAVFGGIYCLRHSITCLLLDKDSNRCKAVIDSRGQRISCSHFVVEDGYVGADRKKLATPTRLISRAVLITDSSVLLSDSDQQVSMVTVPPIAAGCPAVRMVELCSSTMTCMPGTYLVHLTCQSVGSAYEDLSPVVTKMFRTAESPEQENCPSVLWCLYFNVTDGSGLEVEGYDLPSNVYVCSGPDAALGHDHAIKQAESIFQKILPDEDFCPPAPNPEDIIYDGDNPSSSTGEETEGAGEEAEGAGEETEVAGEEAEGAGEETEVAGEEAEGAGKEVEGAGEETEVAGEEEKQQESLQTEE